MLTAPTSYDLSSSQQQVARMRYLAVRALGAYPLSDPELRFVTHGENTTFRVDATAPDGRDRFLLRVHRPARHGRHVDSAAAIGSELDWLMALRADTDLSVPEPFRTIEGQLTTAVASRDVPEPRVCSVLRWMDGRVHAAAPRPVHLRRLGSVMARLHNHAGRWRVPPGFVRIRWDWETFFGDTMVYGGINAADVRDLLPDALRRRFDRVAARMERVMMQLGDGIDEVGLIHADLHLGNALFCRDDVRVIDFDDCGFGYWLYDIAVALWELRHRNCDQAAVQVNSPDYGLKGVGQDGRLVPPARFFLVFTEFEVAAEMQPACDIGKHVHFHHGSALPGQQGFREIRVRSEQGVGHYHAEYRVADELERIGT